MSEKKRRGRCEWRRMNLLSSEWFNPYLRGSDLDKSISCASCRIIKDWKLEYLEIRKALLLLLLLLSSNLIWYQRIWLKREVFEDRYDCATWIRNEE